MVIIFRRFDVVMNFLEIIQSLRTLRSIEEIHMQRNGSAERVPFW